MLRRILVLLLVVLMAYSVNPDLLRAIRSYNGPVPKDVLLATTLVESGGNPYGPGGDGGRSWGAWQEYDLGRGKGLTRAQRQDPLASTNRAIREFTQYYNKGYRGGKLAAAAQRPANAGAYAGKVDSLLGEAQRLLGGGLGAGQLGSSASGVTGGELPDSGMMTRQGLGLAALQGRRSDESFTSAVRRALAAGGGRVEGMGSRPLVDGPPMGMSSPQGDGAADTGAVSAAKMWLGTPYSWGGGTTAGPGMGFGSGAGIKGFDCSSLVQYAWAKQGVKLPRTTYGQIKAGRAVRHLSDLRPGDLLFPSRGHVQMYIGNGQVIHSPRTGDVVRIAPLGKNFVAIRRPGGR